MAMGPIMSGSGAPRPRPPRNYVRPESTEEVQKVTTEQAEQEATEDTRISTDDLRDMSATDIVAAMKAGKLDHLLNGDG